MPPEHSGGFDVLDYAIVIVYFLAMIYMGYRLGRKQEDTEDYFLASGRMAWWAIAISFFAGAFSTISYVSAPGEAYDFGMTMWLGMLTRVVTLPIAILVFVRFMYRLRVWTTNQYLELRFSVSVRVLGTCLSMLGMTFYMGIMLYVTSIVLNHATGWNQLLCIVVIGIAATAYTSLGGLTAVIWTDVIQFFVLILGILIIIGLVAWETPDGVLGIWRIGIESGKGFHISNESGFWDFNLMQRITIWAWVMSILPDILGPGFDQGMLQRCRAAKSFGHATISVLTSSFAAVPLCFLFYFAGMAIYVYFQNLHPGTVPDDMPGSDVFTYYVSNVLPIGIRGLIGASLLAAVMSSVDSSLNTVTSMGVKDIYQRLIAPNRNETHYLNVGKLLTAAWGAFAILVAVGVYMVVTGFDVPLIETTYLFLGFTGSILMGLYASGVFFRRTNTVGVLIGVPVGAAVALTVIIVYYLIPTAEEGRLSFLWLGQIAIGVTVFASWIVSLCYPSASKSSGSKYLIWSLFSQQGRSQWAKHASDSQLMLVAESAEDQEAKKTETGGFSDRHDDTMSS